MSFVVMSQDGKKYVKRTCKMGAFYGNFIVTDKFSEARHWSREVDAKRFCNLIESRALMYAGYPECHADREASFGTPAVKEIVDEA